MVQVHTVYEASQWRTTVDGLRQGDGVSALAVAVARGRRIAAELGGRHIVHDIDGTVTEMADFAAPAQRREPVHYLG